MVIRLDDRVADVIAADERILELFIAASPRFAALRNPLMRKTMGRLATIEQAARVGGLDPEVLLEYLNAGAARGAGPADAPPPPPAPQPPAGPTDSTTAAAGALDLPEDAPPGLRSVPAAKVVDLDVREALREGQEPFSHIMAARRTVPEGGALRLRAIFEPVPLYAVMQKQGFTHWTQRLAHDDWVVWFHPADGEPVADAAPPTPVSDPSPTENLDDADENIHLLDVRGLEPPEPMVRTLAMLAELPDGATLIQINQRVPQFLLPKLDELGYQYEVREQDEDLVRIFIRHG